MKKRILSMILALVMLIGLVPEMGISVSAEGTSYDLWVGGVQVASDNLVIDSADNAAIEGSATYNPETCTLTLNGFSYTGEGRVTQYYNAAISTDSINLNVELHGTNTITCQSNDENITCYAISVMYSLDSSAGHLTIYGTDKETDKLICTANDGISSVRSITVEDAAVQTNGAPIISRLSNLTITDSIVSADLEAGDITLENSALEISETAYTDDNFTITNSTVTGGVLSAFDDASTLTVTGSQVNVTVISAYGFIIEGNSNVTAQAISVDRALIVTDSSVHVTGCEIPELGLEGSFGILLLRSDSVVFIDNSIVEVYGGNGAYLYTDDFLTFTPFAPWVVDGEELADPDDYTVIAGDNAESAVEVDSPTDVTYASKYVKIVPIQTYDVWVAGQQFTSEKLSIEGDSGTATYDPATKTLTLNGFSYTGQGYVYDSPWCAAIFSKNDLTVEVVGSNTVTASVTGNYTAEALNVWGALTITGDSGSSLTLTGAGRDGVGCGGNLKIENVTVNATGTSGLSSGEGNITINNAEVTATATTNQMQFAAAIYAYEGNITIENSTVTANAPYANAVYSYKSNFCYTIKNSNVTISAAEMGIGLTPGTMLIVENSTVEVTSDAGLAIVNAQNNFGAVPRFTGTHVVYAGDDAGSATEADASADATYANKYVKIVPAYTVTYMIGEDEVYTEKVEHGKDVANVPEVPAKAGHTAAWDSDGKNITADTVINAVYTKNESGEYSDVTPDTNVGGGKITEKIEKLKEKVPFTPEEKLQIEYGADVEIWLEIKDISKSVPTADQNEIEKKLGAAKVGMYLDITMYKQVGENEAFRLTQLSDKVQITFKLDDSYINTDKDVTRTYSIIHVHDGKAEVITPVFDANAKTLSFQTDRFSTYALVYTDVVNTPPAETPATGDSFQPVFWIACMTLSIFGIAVLLLDAKRRHAR